MRNIKVQVKSFDLVPRLLPELHRKSERRRKLQVGFNGVFRRLQATVMEEGCLLACLAAVSIGRWPETRLEVQQQNAHSDRQNVRRIFVGKEGKRKRKGGERRRRSAGQFR